MSTPGFDPIPALYASAYAVWSLSLTRVGFDLGVYDYLKDAKVGDMVIETTAGIMALHRDDRETMHKGLGRLEKIAREPFHDDATWEEVKDDWAGQERPTETVYYILNLDGSVCRWTNASFVRVVEGLDPWKRKT